MHQILQFGGGQRRQPFLQIVLVLERPEHTEHGPQFTNIPCNRPRIDALNARNAVKAEQFVHGSHRITVVGLVHGVANNHASWPYFAGFRSAEVDAVSNQLSQIQSLFSLQLAQITDLRQAEASLTAVQAEQLRLQAELAIAQERLRAITGIEAGELHILRESTTLPQAVNGLQFWIEMAERNNQDLDTIAYVL